MILKFSTCIGFSITHHHGISSGLSRNLGERRNIESLTPFCKKQISVALFQQEFRQTRSTYYAITHKGDSGELHFTRVFFGLKAAESSQTSDATGESVPA